MLHRAARTRALIAGISPHTGTWLHFSKEHKDIMSALAVMIEPAGVHQENSMADFGKIMFDTEILHVLVGWQHQFEE